MKAWHGIHFNTVIFQYYRLMSLNIGLQVRLFGNDQVLDLMSIKYLKKWNYATLTVQLCLFVLLVKVSHFIVYRIDINLHIGEVWKQSVRNWDFCLNKKFKHFNILIHWILIQNMNLLYSLKPKIKKFKRFIYFN